MKASCGSAALSVALAACSAIDGHQHVPGWPELKIVEHQVEHAEMRERCMRAVSISSSPEGCTWFHFDRGEAHIFVSKELPTPWVLKQQRLHAAGYDHAGSTTMKTMLANWRATTRERNYRIEGAAASFNF